MRLTYDQALEALCEKHDVLIIGTLEGKESGEELVIRHEISGKNLQLTESAFDSSPYEVFLLKGKEAHEHLCDALYEMSQEEVVHFLYDECE